MYNGVQAYNKMQAYNGDAVEQRHCEEAERE